MAGVLFLSLGGFLATLHWRIPFLIYTFSLLLIPMCFFFLKEPKSSAISATVAAASPLLLKVLFPIGTLFMILFYLMPTQLPFLLKTIGEENPAFARNALAINALGMVCSSVLYSKIRQRFSFLTVAWLALAMMGVGYFLTGNLPSLGALLPVVFVAGLGQGLFIANLNFWVLELSPAAIRGKTMGTLTACLFLGQFSSPVVAEPIIRSSNLSSLFTSSLLVILIMGATLTVFSKTAAEETLG